LIFGTLAVAQDRLRGVLIAPEVRVGGAGFEGFQAFTMLRGVKENSEPWRCAVLGFRSGIGGLRGSWVGCGEVFAIRASLEFILWA
jgi:hypothetical protein